MAGKPRFPVASLPGVLRRVIYEPFNASTLPMARPKKQPSEKLSRRLPHIRCTESEYASIQAKASQAGMTLSSYVRQAALSGQVVVKESTEDELLWQVRKIGTNLNQLTKRAHQTGVFPRGLEDTLEAVEHVFVQLLTPDR